MAAEDKTSFWAKFVIISIAVTVIGTIIIDLVVRPYIIEPVRDALNKKA